jgi:small GTP-binding protein
MHGSSVPRYKVVFVGDYSVGKASLIQSYFHQELTTFATLGATGRRAETRIDDAMILLDVWDTAGQESLRNRVAADAKGSQAAVIVVDLTVPRCDQQVHGWYDYIIQNAGEILICLAVNKSDLTKDGTYANVFQWAREHQVEMVCTSATQRVNVEQLCELVGR